MDRCPAIELPRLATGWAVAVTFATARSSSPGENAPSKRVEMMPFLSMTNVHGSVCSW